MNATLGINFFQGNFRAFLKGFTSIGKDTGKIIHCTNLNCGGGAVFWAVN
jgi:hypothetical protein